MRLRRALAAARLRAEQLQAIGGRRFAGNPHAATLQVLVSRFAAKARQWCLRWSVHVVGAGVVLLIVGWGFGIIALPDPAGQAEQTIQQQIDSEDDALCRRFGFVPGTQAHIGCTLDLADLRRRDGELLATDLWF